MTDENYTYYCRVGDHWIKSIEKISPYDLADLSQKRNQSVSDYVLIESLVFQCDVSDVTPVSEIVLIYNKQPAWIYSTDKSKFLNKVDKATFLTIKLSAEELRLFLYRRAK